MTLDLVAFAALMLGAWLLVAGMATMMVVIIWRLINDR
jgi:hypothetical protein